MPKFYASLIKKANPKLIERVKLGSDGTLKGNSQIKKILLTEGYNEKEVARAIVARTLLKQNKNSSRSAAIAGIIVLVLMFSDSLSPEYNLVKLSISVIACIAIFFIYRYSTLRQSILNKQ
jgi:hypothetical protein